MLHLKQAVQIEVPLGLLTPVGAGAVNAKDADGEFSISLPTAATAYKVQIPFTGIMPWRTDLGGDPYGFSVTSISLWYLIGAVDATVNLFKLMVESPNSGAARAAATGYNGNVAASLTVTNNGAAGTAAAPATGVTLVTTNSANVNLSVITLVTPTFLSADTQFLTGDWAISTGAASGTASIKRVLLKGTYGLLA